MFGPALQQASDSLSAKRLSLEATPKELFARILTDHENAFLLESAKGQSKLAEYSFIGFDPSHMVTVKDSVFEYSDMQAGRRDTSRTEDPLSELRRIVPPNSVSGLFRFIGGAVGYISYDAVRYFEKLPAKNPDDLGFPDMQFGVYSDGVVFDHGRQEYYYYSLGRDRSAEVESAARSRLELGSLSATERRPTVSQEGFERMVAEAKEHVAGGDVFQTVLSKRYDFELTGDLMAFYQRLSEVNPSPYMYFLKFGERKIVGSSPEMLLRVEDRRAETYPIAGTRPRVADPAANKRLTEELLRDPKEVAEHVMLVDLARNDVGRVALYGSMKVPEFLTVEQFSHVQHIVSHVSGELRREADSFDALRAVFPAGTVSGAPKVRAMEVIEELEPLRRGPYAGAVGYFSFNGNADFAITIRTLVSEGKRCSVQSGAGIVADSVPENEWKETEAKAEAIFSAVALAEEGSP